MKKIAVVGASGFVGNAVVDRLVGRDDCSLVPLIRSSGNAWRLAKRGIEPKVVDLLSPAAVKDALAGCTHVINCSRGDAKVMLGGLRNLLDAASAASIKGFVHLSSVSVYGDPPDAASASEDAAPPPLDKSSYGYLKLEQDEMIARAARKGLPSVILCPPNISGPYSPYLNGLVETLRARQFALLENGRGPCNLVDVDNLALAVELALDKGTSDPTRLFITDGEATTWRDVIDALMPLTGRSDAPPIISREALQGAHTEAPAARASLFRSLKHLVSSDVRAALRKDPIWASADGLIRRSAAALGPGMEDRLRLSIEGPLPVRRSSGADALNLRLSSQQLRAVRHSCARAEKLLGYRPIYSFAQSMDAYRNWYRILHRMDGPDWAILKELY